MRPEHWLFAIPLRLRSLFGRAQVDQELDDELRDHLERATEEYVGEGMAPDEARRRARLDLGGIEQTKEKCRDARRVNWIQDFVQDLRFGLHMLRKNPGFTTLAVLTLALGIGANTAIFSLIDGVMLRSLPVRDPDRLVVLQWTARRNFVNGEYSSFGDCGESGGTSSSGCSFPFPIVSELRAQTNVFSGVLACAGPESLDLGGNGPARTADGEIVSGDYFSTLGVNAFIGRTLGTSDDSPAAPPVTVLSYGYWQSAFGGARSVLGRIIQLNNVAFTIVGVAEPGFTNLAPGKTQDLWLTIAMAPRLRIDWGTIIDMRNWWLLTMARLKPGVSVAQAQAAASIVFRDEVLYGPKPYAKATDDPKVLVMRPQEALIGTRGDLSRTLSVLMLAVGIILLIACANVAGLLLARAATREKEMAVRLALGSGRGRLLRQLLTESVLLSVLSGIVGILFAYWGVRAVTALIIEDSSGRFPYIVGVDWRVLGFALGICVLTGVIFGLAPAFRSVRLELTFALKENVPSLPSFAAGPRDFRLGSALVVAQVALSVLVLTGAGLLLRTLENLHRIDPGFDVRNLLLFEIEPGRLGYKDAHIRNLFSEFRDRLAALPGISSASYSSVALLTGAEWGTRVHVEGQPQDTVSDMVMLAASPEFFDTMRIPLIEGRLFSSTDFETVAQKAGVEEMSRENPPAQMAQSAGAATVGANVPAATVSVLVNQAFVRKYFPNENALGKGITRGGSSGASGGAWTSNSRARDWQIVGVVGNTKYKNLRREILPIVYLPFTSSYGGYFELRTAGDPHALIPAVRAVANEIDSNLPLSGMRTQTRQIEQMLTQERLIARLFAFFGLLALALACVGLYGILSYEVSLRTREMGIRIALGAQQRDVLRLIVKQGLALSCVGIAIGVSVALVLSRYLDSMLYGIHANDPGTIVAVAALLACVALLACYIPARRATRVDPMVALRYE